MTRAPTLLAIETSTDACSVALCHQSIVQETFIVQPRAHNALLLPMIDELMRGLQLSFADLDAIAFSAGPGSFTGLRLSAGVVQGLAFAAQKPVLPISSLAALALSVANTVVLPAGNTHSTNTLLTVVNAHMNDVYLGAYRHENGTIVALADDQLLPLAQLAEHIAHYQPATVITSGLQNALNLPTENHFITDAYPHAKVVLALAKIVWAKGLALPAEQALPVYLRETISWQKWQPKGGRTT